MLRWRRVGLWLMLCCATSPPCSAQTPLPIGGSGGYLPSGGPPPMMPAGPAAPAPPAMDPYLYSKTGFPIPNAWEQGGDEKYAALMQFKVDFMSMWVQPNRTPPTITTGSAADPAPGALGQPNSLILNSGPQTLDRGFGSRFFLTYWLADPEILAIDGNYFTMEKLSTSRIFESDTNGTPFIARPYYNVAAGNAPAALVVASPGLTHGYAVDRVSARMMGAEANLKLNVNGGSYNGTNLCGPSLYLIGGARWMQFNEQFLAQTSASNIPGNTTTTYEDDFRTSNNFIGGQVGGQFRYRLWRFTFDMIGKCAFGPNFETATLQGQTSNRDAANNVLFNPNQGIYVQSSNAGSYDKRNYAFLPEGSVGMGFDINDHIRFNTSWTVLALTNLVRPQTLIDTSVNLQPFAGVPAAPFNPAQPNLSQTNVWTHWLSFGFELVY